MKVNCALDFSEKMKHFTQEYIVKPKLNYTSPLVRLWVHDGSQLVPLVHAYVRDDEADEAFFTMLQSAIMLNKYIAGELFRRAVNENRE